MNRLTDEQLKAIWKEAGEERLSGYFEAGWHYPGPDERVFQFVRGIQQAVDPQGYIANAFTKEDVAALHRNAYKKVVDLFTMGGFDDEKRQDTVLYSPATMLKLVDVVIEQISKNIGARLEDPSL